MKITNVLIFILAALLLSCNENLSLVDFETDAFNISINNKGYVTALEDSKTGTNYCAHKDSIAPLLSVRFNNEILYPQEAAYDEAQQVITLKFAHNNTATVIVEEKTTHINFELKSVSNPDDIELVIWGPFPTTINKVIGETIGVVQGDNFAIGLQALNIKTIGGYPWNESDYMPQLDVFEQDDPEDLSKGKRGVLYSVEAAKPTSFGSTIQAFCRNRNKDRVIPNWGHEHYVAPAFDDGGVTGSKIALFGCPVDKALDNIGAIEVAEGLPHPMLNGVWAKKSPLASASYLIIEFTESSIDKAIEYTQKAGMNYLYHSDPFETWGHFDLNKRYFPSGVEGLKNCVEKADKAGIKMGVHTLSNFINIKDAYVTPVPDKRLAQVGSSVLSSAITATQTEIPIASPVFFNQFNRNVMRTVMIGEELIRYGGISESAPWRLLNCGRGAFGTTAGSHNNGATIAKLADHGYKVFLTNPELSLEVAKNTADLFNKTGLAMISFDGLEGNRSTGLGNYGEALFAQTWYDALKPEIKAHFICDASRPGHFFWHTYNRMNWGEPWYGGFRESQTAYRMKNQAYFKRNLMPGMLGWFRMTPQTTPEDVKWLMARSAAYNAGFAFFTSFSILEANGETEAILHEIKKWETARLSGFFNTGMMQQMEDVNTEYELTTDKNGKHLLQVYSHRFEHLKKVRQPGEPLYSTFSFTNSAEEQVAHFIITAKNGSISSIEMDMDGYKTIRLAINLDEGESIKYEGGNSAFVYNANQHKIKTIALDPQLMTVSKGDHQLTFDCSFVGGNNAKAKIELRLTGQGKS